MDRLIIRGPAQLKGKVRVSSSKNAALPIMAACLLNPKSIFLNRLPHLRDVNTTLKLLTNLGVEVNKVGEVTEVKAEKLTSLEATYDLVKTMRASILVLGPLLARFHHAKVSLPGGCAIGARPIDIHLEGLQLMGAKIDLRSGYVKAQTDENGLVGADILLSFPSVGATENLMMAAVLAKGTTLIKNAAREPEIEELQNFINMMGGKVEGAGTSTIKIEGVNVEDLQSINFEVFSDRIEAATYLMAGVMTNSEITVENIIPQHMEALLSTLKSMGAKLNIDRENKTIHTLKWEKLKGIKVETAPYTGFPTDMQAQLMSLSTIASSSSVLTEHIFENRFMHVPELVRMGASITLKGHSAFIDGNSQLTGAPVMCTDLRASAALVLAAMVAKGQTVIQRVYHLDRGYEDLDKKLINLGVEIIRDRSEGAIENPESND